VRLSRALSERALLGGTGGSVGTGATATGGLIVLARALGEIADNVVPIKRGVA
jgi:hypothetical protein